MENNSGCLVCGQDMMQSDGCRVAVMYHCGEQYVRIPFRGFHGERCGDCNALSGNYHHWGCDLERCPVCGGQLISCECMDVECQVIINKKRKDRKANVRGNLKESTNCTPNII